MVVLFYLNDPVIVIDGYQMNKSKKEKRPPRDHPEIVIEEEGDEKADWLKYLNDGKEQQKDLAVHVAALKMHRERGERDE